MAHAQALIVLPLTAAASDSGPTPSLTGSPIQGEPFYASDYFGKLYDFAVELIKMGKAYVCDLTAEQMIEYRGAPTVPGKESPYRNRSVEENLDLFARMRAGEFPDGAKTAKIHWTPETNQYFPDATVPGVQHDVDFMVKDNKRFGDVGGWGYAVFRYDAATDAFTPGTTADQPPQANDAKCGVACHTIVKANDYVFTQYGHR